MKSNSLMGKETLDKYDLVVGLEVHAQLQTQTKIFSRETNKYGTPPNTNIGLITLAHPGTLPKLNKEVAKLAVRMGLACGSKISSYNIFDRKNYFYPDLPKGYQLTQDATPICIGGQIDIHTQGSGTRSIALNRIHLEEDAGKSIHQSGSTRTLIDLNRAGVPLIEIVSEPVIHLAEEAAAYLTELRQLLRYLEICDGNMEEGSMRCDANISIKPKGQEQLGTKVEIKNMNSIRNVQRAIDLEYERQVELLESGQDIISETRDFRVEENITVSMRTKETLNDYRYFPEPDLAPLLIDEAFIAKEKAQMPELPQQRLKRLMKQYKLGPYDAAFLTESRQMADYFEAVSTHVPSYKAIANWLMGPIQAHLKTNGQDIYQLSLTPQKLAALIALVDTNQVSNSAAQQQILPQLLIHPDSDPLLVAQKLNLVQERNQNILREAATTVVGKYPSEVEKYRNGKKSLIGFFMGEIMKATKGKADPKQTKTLLTEILAKS